MESHSAGQLQSDSQRLNFAVQRILADDVHFEIRARLRERSQRTQQRGLVLDPIQTRGMNQSGGLGRVATHGLARRPNVEIDAQRQSLRWIPSGASVSIMGALAAVTTVAARRTAASRTRPFQPRRPP